MRVECVTCQRDYIECARFGACLKEVTKDKQVTLCEMTTTDSDGEVYNNSTDEFLEENML